MAVNLVRNYTREDAHHLLNSSFGQFLADRGVVVLERQLERDRAYLEGYRRSMACDRGDFAEYWQLRERAARVREEARRGRQRGRQHEVRDALESLRPGDVIFLPGERRRGLAVVLGNREGRPTVLTEDRRSFRLSPVQIEEPLRPVAHIELPRSGSARSARFRRDIAASLAGLNVRPPRPSRRARAAVDPQAEAKAEELDAKAREHPVHSCPDRSKHERWAQRAAKLEREIASLERRIRARTETLGRQFDRVIRVLAEMGYVEEFVLTDKGEALRRIYGEGDLLVAESLAAGAFHGLSHPELAGLVSTMVYESREREPSRPELPTPTLRSRYRELVRIWRRIREVEDSHQVELSRELDPGFVPTVFDWAEGKPLEDVLATAGLQPGDFVRNCKQLLDLLRQVEGVAPSEVSSTARVAVEAVNRGVVSYTGVSPVEL
jgi:ATP-dependent RNA helicase HelY